MCGRNSLFAPPETLKERFDAALDYAYRPRYNLAPGEGLAVVPNDRPGTITRQEWGLLAPWADDPEDGPRPINARAETVAEKPLFEEPFAERRCLVLSSGFYEWRGDRGSKLPYRVHLADDEPFAMAGLWNRWSGGGRGDADGDADGGLETVTVVTCEPNDVVAPIHDRMPVILAPGEERTWLDADPDDARALLDPYAGDDLRAYPVSTRVNDPGHDDPSVIEPADRGEQAGLGDFGA